LQQSTSARPSAGHKATTTNTSTTRKPGGAKRAATKGKEATTTAHKQHGAFELSDSEWKTKLSAEEFAVLREGKTEDAGVGKYVAHVGNGMYMCAGCGIELYESSSKFDYACGWPAFRNNRVGAVKHIDVSKGSGPKKVEIRCTGQSR
jgi:hypothetical protein